MNTKTSVKPTPEKPDFTKDIVKRLIQIGGYILVQAAILFLAAGRLQWAMAWVYLGLYVAMIAVNAVIILPRHPELIAERSRVKEDAKAWDRVISTLVGVSGLLILVAAGLDTRFGWSPRVALATQFAGTALLISGWCLVIWAMASNEFFSTVVRIQTDRGHMVVNRGPYGYVRHPGYVGMMTSGVGTALMLASLWALIPAGLLVGAGVVRTALEDKTLRAELGGYEEYVRKVRYRLIPGVW